MCASISEQELSTCGDNPSERCMASWDCCAVCMGYLDKHGAAVVDYETEKRGSQVI